LLQLVQGGATVLDAVLEALDGIHQIVLGSRIRDVSQSPAPGDKRLLTLLNTAVDVLLGHVIFLLSTGTAFMMHPQFRRNSWQAVIGTRICKNFTG
jgi:hypothetical protein